MAGACTKTEEHGPSGEAKPILTFSPSCGKAGDRVKLTLDTRDARDTEEIYRACFRDAQMEVSFLPGTREPIAFAPAGDVCEGIVIVPGPARTGPIEIIRSHTLGNVPSASYVSKETFTIPCPEPEAGVDGGVDGSPPDTPLPPIGAVIRQERFETSTVVNVQAYTFEQGLIAGRAADIKTAETVERAALEPPGVAVGTCGPLVVPPPSTNLPPLVFRGVLTVKAGADTVVGPKSCDPDFIYRSTYSFPSVAPGSALDVTFAGNRAENGFSVPNAAPTIPELTITSPVITGAQVDVPQGALQLLFNAQVASYMTIFLARAGGAPVACVPDPKLGTFLVPANVIGGPGQVDVEVRIGVLRKLAIAQAAFGIMTMSVHTRAFTLNVQ